VVLTAAKILRNFGFFPQLLPDGSVGDVRETIRHSGPTSLLSIHVVSTLKFASEAYKATEGRDELAAQYWEAANFAYMISTGFENDLSAIDEPLPT